MLPKTDFYVRLGGRIKAARVGRGLKQKTLAHQLDISRATLANIESGRQAVQAFVVAQIAEILTTSVESLYPSAVVSAKRDVPDSIRDRPTAQEWFRRVVPEDAS